MLFTHDTECSLTAAAALVNTDAREGEALPDVAALDAFYIAHAYTGRHEHTADELRAVRRLRPRLRRIWHAGTDEIVAIVNGLLREYDALPQLITHGDEPYHFHAVPRDAPLAARMAVEAAMAMADLVRTGELGRLRICDHPGCENVLVDLSKNRSRRFCDAGCGNRAAVSAYRARRAASRS
ncbi:CGNR zinc finger domain-containing protein [Micromonospora sp. NPDC047074]|uniref:CGNR zinc finger domain-containing protein n=1 Tax=Micromonospora sp. NPDC047074 TaxID=3154339 RepID=UPI0033F092CE